MNTQPRPFRRHDLSAALLVTAMLALLILL